jgi:hypothetical protein
MPLTDRLLVSLEGATKADVTKAMKAIGRPLGRDEEAVLHFVIPTVRDRELLPRDLVAPTSSGRAEGANSQ